MYTPGHLRGFNSSYRYNQSIYGETEILCTNKWIRTIVSIGEQEPLKIITICPCVKFTKDYGSNMRQGTSSRNTGRIIHIFLHLYPMVHNMPGRKLPREFDMKGNPEVILHTLLHNKRGHYPQ